MHEKKRKPNRQKDGDQHVQSAKAADRFLAPNSSGAAAECHTNNN